MGRLPLDPEINLDRCLEVMRYIKDYKRRHDGNSPSIREMAKNLGGVSTSHVFNMLKRLEEFGYIRLPKRGEARSLETVDGCWTWQEGRGGE